jgi:hypothetical protein
MRIIVNGDRAWYCPELADQIIGRLIYRYGPNIVHGAATDIDRSFAEACQDTGIDQEAYQARWEDIDHPDAVIRYDKKNRPFNSKAGPLRNQEMVDAGADLCIAFHRAISSSKGTKDCVRRAIAARIPTWLIDSEKAVPRRLAEGDARLK